MTDERVELARQLLAEGKSIAAVAIEHHAEWGYKSAATCANALSREIPVSERPARRRRPVERAPRPVREPRRRGRRTLITPDRLAGVRQELEAGGSLWSIAQAYYATWGYSTPETCNAALCRLIPRSERPARGAQPSRMTSQRVAVARRLIDAGFTLYVVASEASRVWGYERPRGCERALRDAGVVSPKRTMERFPDLNRGEALALIQEAA